jgi:hypothetical protein
MNEQSRGRVLSQEEEERDDRPLSTADVARATDTQPMRQPPREEEVVSPSMATQQEHVPLLPGEQTTEFRLRWDQIQTSFVDEPKQAVQQADSLVAELMQKLAKSFADERQNLENQWGRGDDVSTEDLRISLQRYRSFFSRLLSI